MTPFFSTVPSSSSSSTFSFLDLENKDLFLPCPLFIPWKPLSLLPFNKETVHSAWSKYTKKKHQHKEFYRLEYVSWRLWFSWHSKKSSNANGKSKSKSKSTFNLKWKSALSNSTSTSSCHLKKSPRFTSNMHRYFQSTSSSTPLSLSHGNPTPTSTTTSTNYGWYAFHSQKNPSLVTFASNHALKKHRCNKTPPCDFYLGGEL
ncbi:hypothetical protein HMI54_007472 [Coelomomyces lativittatus]|nr:hypothetical protein HMI56_001194 [Coelomomyces lativittatus]KAJ1514391.1 hypothetical protein HMI55_004690 [Coelomomyces lativittatus]KAJ1516990.1 hypothetical protein HMI54_007472 [Coelomomyces lativittatus]